MSKKYRLIKWYPSLSKAMPIGFIMYKNEKLCNYSNLQHNFIALSLDEVENNPEFWEEIVDKKSLFTTEDGVNIFENDIVHWVKLYGQFKYLYPLRLIKEHLMMDFISGYRVFSTEKAAKDWIDLNSPKYSLQDIENAVKSFNWGPFTFNMLKNALNNK